jgi:hypothetical protein
VTRELARVRDRASRRSGSCPEQQWRRGHDHGLRPVCSSWKGPHALGWSTLLARLATNRDGSVHLLWRTVTERVVWIAGEQTFQFRQAALDVARARNVQQLSLGCHDRHTCIAPFAFAMVANHIAIAAIFKRHFNVFCIWARVVRVARSLIWIRARWTAHLDSPSLAKAVLNEAARLSTY